MKELLKIVAKKLFIWSIIFSTIYSLADYGESIALSYFGTSPLTLEKIIKLAITITILDIIMLISGKVVAYIDGVNFTQVETSIHKYYFEKMQSISMQKMVNTHTGYIHNLIIELANAFFDFTWYLEVTVIPLIIGTISIFSMVCKQSVITGIICIVIGGLAVYFKYKMKRDREIYDKKVREEKSKYNATLVDFIQNIVTVRKLNMNKFCNQKINEKKGNYLKISKINERKKANQNFVFTALMNLLYIVIFGSTIILVKNGEDGLPYLLFYMSALGKIYSNLNSLVLTLDRHAKFKGAKEQLDEFFKDNIETNLVKEYKQVELINVNFSYNENSTKIKIPEFTFQKGDKISIVGESGQGKTTTMNILAGIYPLDEGTLLIDGKEEKNKRLDLVFVSQEVDLFDMSIRDNLCLGKDVSDDKIFELLKEAGLMTWYRELENGLDTMVGERGVKLSAGQKQRLNLIRGILIDKDVYFFDEPTSNLDTVSEQKITKMIEKYLNDKTYVIVTHRPKLKELCNRHYIFEDHIMKEVVKL